jgi:hypothetical protein
MAMVISESSSSTGTTSFPSPTTSIPLFLPGPQRRAESSNLFRDQFEEQPTFQRVQLNKLVTEAFHGESSTEAFHGEPSTELRNEQLGVTAVRAPVNFGINQARMDSRHDDSKTAIMDMDVDSEETLLSTGEKEEWESIQEYGKYLGETADTFQYADITESALLPASVPQKQRTREKVLSWFEWFSWRNFQFQTEFAQFAPLTTHETRIYAQQSTNLIDWILDWGNDGFFGWQSLGQVVGPPPHSEETRRDREITEQQALQQILEVVVDPVSSTPRPWGIRSSLEGIPERPQSSFAQYLSQEAPQSRGTPCLGGSEPSRSSSRGGSDEDTRSIVSQDNHWRRTIFG